MQNNCHSLPCFLVCAFVLLERGASFHGLQLPSSDFTPPQSTASISASPSRARQSQHASDPILVQGIAASGDGSGGAFVLPELKFERFGYKQEKTDEAPPVAEASIPPSSDKGWPLFRLGANFFQVGTEQTLEHTPENEEAKAQAMAVPASQDSNASLSAALAVPNNNISVMRHVGKLALEGNLLAPASRSAEVVAELPPALSEVLPLPFDSDSWPAARGGHIHVAANIVTQEIDAVSNKSNQTNGKKPVVPPLAQKPAIHSEKKDILGNANATKGSSGASVAELAAQTSSSAQIADSPQPKDAAKPSQSRPERTTLVDVARPANDAASKSPGVASLTPRSTLIPLSMAFAAILLAVGICFACLGASFVALLLWQRGDGSPTRSRVERLPVCRAPDVERLLPASAGYDCQLSKPMSSGQVLRLEARVEGPLDRGASLTSPLTGQPCVLFSAAVSRQLHDGVQPAPVAFASGSSDFVIVLEGASHVRITVRADEVSLFDMRHGRCVQQRAFAAAPEKWQDFILTHRAGTEWQTSSQLRSDSSSLEFQECALFCGSLATFVGELHRSSDGTLSLRPLQVENVSGNASSAKLQRLHAESRASSDQWRTSWERGGCEASNVASTTPSPRAPYESMEAPFEKILASDDPLLLDGASFCEGVSSLLSGSRSMVRRIPSKCSTSVTSLMSVQRSEKRTYTRRVG